MIALYIFMFTTIILSVGIIILSLNRKRKTNVNEKDFYKFEVNKSIPKNIFISIANKDILNDDNNKVTKIIKNIKNNFNEYEIKIFDDNESYELIKSFNDKLLTICYEEIIPNAFKCDIFRLVVLYKYGGLYVDAGREIIPTYLKNLLNNNEMIFCRDRTLFFKTYYLYNGFMATYKENKFLLESINQIKYNISNFKNGKNALDITGPRVLGNVYKKYFGYNCEEGQQFSNVYILKDRNTTKKISLDNKNITIIKPKTRDNLGKSNNLYEGIHYNKLWKENKIFYQKTINDWYKTAKDYHINENGFLCAKLKNKKGIYNFSSIKYEPFTKYENKDGKFVKKMF
tara:strand:+ start:8 stop:1036 length:1029 start_codon:yes stop_codon:yes gene_type:complete